MFSCSMVMVKKYSSDKNNKYIMDLKKIKEKIFPDKLEIAKRILEEAKKMKDENPDLTQLDSRKLAYLIIKNEE